MSYEVRNEEDSIAVYVDGKEVGRYVVVEDAEKETKEFRGMLEAWGLGMHRRYLEVLGLMERHREQVRRVEILLEQNGCDCGCNDEHQFDDHEPDCERCFACRVQEALK